MDQGSNKNHSPAYNFAPTVTKFCVMWEGLSLPHDTKFGNCRCKIVDSRSFPTWSLIHGLRWSGLIKVGPGPKHRHYGNWEHNNNRVPAQHEHQVKKIWQHFLLLQSNKFSKALDVEFIINNSKQLHIYTNQTAWSIKSILSHTPLVNSV